MESSTAPLSDVPIRGMYGSEPSGSAQAPGNHRTVRSQSIVIMSWRDTGHPDGGGSEVYVERMAAARRPPHTATG
jgi:hypothetical protein